MDKKNILLFWCILILALLMRFWRADFNIGIPILSQDNIYSIFLGNTWGILNDLILKFVSLPYISVLKPYLSLIWSISGVITIYFAGCEYGLKNREQSGLLCMLLAALSPFLVGLSFVDSIYSLVFFLSSLVILYSIKTSDTKSKRNEFLLWLFSLILVLVYNPAIFFVIFNMISLFVFKKKHKGMMNGALCLLGVLILLLPIMPFIIKAVNNLGPISDYGMSFNWMDIVDYLKDTFSVGIFLESGVSFYNFGAILFVFIPLIISLLFIIRGLIGIKKEGYYPLGVIISTFLSFVIICFLGGVKFSAFYLITILPLLIILFTKGFYSVKSENLKMIPFALYISIVTIYLILSHFSSILFF